MEHRKIIIKCLNELKAELNITDKWWNRWRWCLEKVSCCSKLGQITISDALKFEDYLEKLRIRAKKLEKKA